MEITNRKKMPCAEAAARLRWAAGINLTTSARLDSRSGKFIKTGNKTDDGAIDAFGWTQ